MGTGPHQWLVWRESLLHRTISAQEFRRLPRPSLVFTHHRSVVNGDHSERTCTEQITKRSRKHAAAFRVDHMHAWRFIDVHNKVPN